jgi:nitroreductase
MDVWDAIRTKRAVRKFTDQPLPDDVARRILDAGRRSQSSKNTQPWHFIVVRGRATLEALSKTGNSLGHVAGSAMCVVLVTEAPSDGFAKIMFDVGQSASYMQLAAQEMSVGSCLGTIYQPDQVRALLGIPEDKQAMFVISFGYSVPDPERKGAGKAGRRPFDEVVHWDRW